MPTNSRSRFFVACLITPVLWVLGVSILWTAFTPVRALSIWALIHSFFLQLVPFIAKWVLAWFVVFFMPLAIWLFRRDKNSLGSFAAYGAIAGCLPFTIIMFVVYGLVARGPTDGRIWGPILGAFALGSVIGAVFGASFSALGGGHNYSLKRTAADGLR